MLKSPRLMLFVCTALLSMSGMLFAQTGTISGKVTDANSGDPLPGANVLVQGLEIGAATNADGEYTIAGVPVGERSVIARFVGYKSKVTTVTVSGGTIAELNIGLKETVLQLDEVVVTGAGVASARKKLGNTVASINASQLEDAPVSSFSEMIQGREAGVSVLPSGGLAGEGARIRIRGSASLSQTNEPVVYVDGIRINAGAGFSIAGGGGVASRLDDINPAAIERVEILKGAAAATLYGTQASNGIIQIFTKKGSFSKPKFTLEIEQNAQRYPETYKPNTGFARSPEQAADMAAAFGIPVQPFELVQRTNVKDILSTGHGQTYALSVSGGGSGVTYFASGRFNHTDGPYNPQSQDFAIGGNPEGFAPGGSNDLNQRAQFSASVNVVPSNKLNFRVSTGYTNTRHETPDNNNNIYGVVSLAMFGKPEFADVNNPQGTVAFATVREATYQENSEVAQRAYVSLSSNYKLTNEITIDANAGLDYTQERATAFRPFAWDVDGFTGATTDGNLYIGNFTQKEWTVDVKANWNRNFGSAISSSFVMGFQGFNTITNFSSGSGTTFPGPGLETLSALDGSTTGTGSSFSEVINAGWFFQEQVGYQDYLYVTAGIRFDANSAFGTNFSTQSYPKVSFSFVPSTAFPSMSSSTLSTFRVRAAIGTSGQQPNAFDNLTTFTPQTSDAGPGVSPGNLGNPDLKPEVSTEIEGGFEAGLFDDKVGLEFTYWDRTVSDAIVLRQFPISGGFLSLQADNIGEIKANGIDLNLRVSALNKENLTLDLFANGAYLQEEVTDLGGAPRLKAGGSYPRYRNHIDEGFAPGVHFGAKLDRDLEYPIDLDGDNVAESTQELLEYFSEERAPTDFKPVLLPFTDPKTGQNNFLLHNLGKPTPDWSGSFGLNLGFMKRFRFSTLFEYKAGNYFVNNLTDAFRKSHGAIGRNTPGAAATELVLLNPSSSAEDRLEAANEWVRTYLALSPYSGLNTIEKADFIRWRELSLAYDLPRTVASSFGLRNATVSVAGRNLVLFSGYSGVDPETNAIGRRSGGGTDNSFLDGVEAFGFPIPRQFVFSLKVGF